MTARSPRAPSTRTWPRLDAAQRGADHVRSTGGPVFVEFRTYRFRAHSMIDPELYRDKAEVDEWRKRDPIPAFTEKCLRTAL